MRTLNLNDPGTFYRCQFCPSPARATMWHRERGSFVVNYCFEHYTEGAEAAKRKNILKEYNDPPLS